MNIYFNSSLIKATELTIAINDRGLSYGDGIFETIVVKNKKIRFLDWHWERMVKGVKALGMSLPDDLTQEKIGNQIYSLMVVNQVPDQARIKIIIWRKEGGLFTPHLNDINIMVTAMPFYSHLPKTRERATVSDKVTLFPSFTSSYKSLNALPYVLAGIEKQEKQMDELILLNHQKMVTEASAGNIFWVKDGAYYTPSLSCGCIDGVMRRHIIESLNFHQIAIHQVEAPVDTLYNADHLFATNVTGIYPILHLDNKKFKNEGLPDFIVNS
jgi:4-amino-4-deoxychorismate lyase